MATVVPTSCASPIGRMVAVKAAAAAPLSVSFDNASIKRLGVCVRLSLHQSVIAQFQNTFGSYIYVVPFGDKPGDIDITFLANRMCEEAADTMDVLEFYKVNRLLPTRLVPVGGNIFVTKKTNPISVTVGKMTFRGYVTGLDIDADTMSGAVVQAVLHMTGWPLA